MQTELGDGLWPGGALWPGHPHGLGFMGLISRYHEFEAVRLWRLFVLRMLEP